MVATLNVADARLRLTRFVETIERRRLSGTTEPSDGYNLPRLAADVKLLLLETSESVACCQR